MFELLILGIIQGVTEWLPISSKSMILLAQNYFFGHDGQLSDQLRLALLLHLGTLLAAVVYFWSDIKVLLSVLARPAGAAQSDKKLFLFLFISTLISGILGGLFYYLLSSYETKLDLVGGAVNAIVGLLLIVTGLIQVFSRKILKSSDLKSPDDLGIFDGIILGVVQGFAAIPGFSRSGLTVAALLFRKFDDVHALRLSFLMSIPIVLAGNIILNLGNFGLSVSNIVGLSASFVFGLLTIKYFLLVARRVNFGYFLVIFGGLLVMAGLL